MSQSKALLHGLVLPWKELGFLTDMENDGRDCLGTQALLIKCSHSIKSFYAENVQDSHE